MICDLFSHVFEISPFPFASSSSLSTHTAVNMISIFISKAKGEELSSLLENGTRVLAQITVGPHSTFRYANINRTSVLFVSVSFIILMIISLAWLIFYYVQRFRYIQAKDILAVSAPFYIWWSYFFRFLSLLSLLSLLPLSVLYTETLFFLQPCLRHRDLHLDFVIRVLEKLSERERTVEARAETWCWSEGDILEHMYRSR